MRVAIACAAVAALTCGGPAQAKEAVGLLAQCNELIRYMDRGDQGRPATYPMGQCLGTVEGVLKTMYTLNNKLPKEHQTCFPTKPLTNGEAVRIVVKYLQETEMTNTDDTTLAMFAIQEAYLCK